jgi:transcription elongation factor GreA
VILFILRTGRKMMPPSFMTQEGFDKLQEELKYLRSVKRQEVADRLHEAMDGGELIEDAEYEAAKNEQAFVEGRIQELEILLANARVIEENTKKDTVQVGAKVTIQEDGQDPEEYTIVGPVEARPRNGRISNESPLGRALMDHRAGDDVEVEAPGGSFVVRILKVR